MGYKLMKISIK